MYGIGQVGALANDADMDVAGQVALADAAVQHRRLKARVGADQHDGVGLFDAGNGGVEQVTGATTCLAQRIAGLAAVQVPYLKFFHQGLEGKHFLDGAQIADKSGGAVRTGSLQLRHDEGEGLVPAGGAQLAVFADVRLVEALRAQAVPDEAGLVGNPLLVDVFVEARQHAHHLAATRTSTRMAEPTASITSTVSVLRSSHGLALNS